MFALYTEYLNRHELGCYLTHISSGVSLLLILMAALLVYKLKRQMKSWSYLICGWHRGALVQTSWSAGAFLCLLVLWLPDTVQRCVCLVSWLLLIGCLCTSVRMFDTMDSEPECRCTTSFTFLGEICVCNGNMPVLWELELFYFIV